MKKTFLLNLFCLFIFTQFVVSAQSVMEYEIVPFDYTDEDMREQLCYMVDKGQKSPTQFLRRAAHYWVLLNLFAFDKVGDKLV